MGFIFLVSAAVGVVIGLCTARRDRWRWVPVALAPLAAWGVLLILGLIETLQTGELTRGLGGVLMISLGYWICVAWAVPLSCFLAQEARLRGNRT